MLKKILRKITRVDAAEVEKMAVEASKKTSGSGLSKGGFRVGDVVRFHDGQVDQDSGIDIGGWVGRVTTIKSDDTVIGITLDSITLKSLSRNYLEYSEEEGMGWEEYYLEPELMDAAEPRDTEEDVQSVYEEIGESLNMAWLGEEGREMNAIMGNARGAYEKMVAWRKHLEANLKFPFSAEVSEWQRPSRPLQSGDKVRVMKIDILDDTYGLIVQVRKKKRMYEIPLADLEVIPDTTKAHDLVLLYATWFANRR